MTCTYTFALATSTKSRIPHHHHEHVTKMPYLVDDYALPRAGSGRVSRRMSKLRTTLEAVQNKIKKLNETFRAVSGRSVVLDRLFPP